MSSVLLAGLRIYARRAPRSASTAVSLLRHHGTRRTVSHTAVKGYPTNVPSLHQNKEGGEVADSAGVKPEHAVISTFDLFSIGVGPSSSHTVGPMRAGKIFITDLQELALLDRVQTLKIVLYGSLAATGKGHHTPQAILLGLEGSDPETIDCGTIPSRYEAILTNKSLHLGGNRRIHFDMDRDMLWRWDEVLKTHPNGMRFSCFDGNGDLLATNEYFR